jgi:hypothetical protein
LNQLGIGQMLNDDIYAILSSSVILLRGRQELAKDPVVVNIAVDNFIVK